MKTTRAILAGIAVVPGTLAADKFFNWEVTYTKQPNTTRDAILINNAWPPPAIEVDVKDNIIVNLNNQNVNETVSLHAHGFHQLYNNAQDGPVGVTQCGLASGNTQMYTWPADQAGTFWVHSHKIGQYPYGLRSPLIVRDSSEPSYYGYDANHDYVFDVADTWNSNMPDVEKKIADGDCCLDNICGLEVPPDSATARDVTTGNAQYDAQNITAGTPMRIRVINMSAASRFIVFADDPDIDLNVIETDGVPLSNANVSTAKSMMVHPGQRYSIMVSSTKSFNLYGVVDPDLYSGNSCQDMLSSSSSGFGGGGGNSGTQYQYAAMATGQFNVNGSVVTPYFAATSTCTKTDKPCYESQNNEFTLQNLPSHASDTDKRVSDEWYDNKKLQPSNTVSRIMYGNDSDSTIIHVDLTTTSSRSDRIATLNDNQFLAQTVPILLAATQTEPTCSSANLVPAPGKGGLTDLDYYGTNNTWHVAQGTKVFLVVHASANVHPFHLHGHDFQVLYLTPEDTSLSATDQQQPSSSNGPSDDKIKDNSYDFPASPMRRDTLQLTARTYAVLAFEANNPGAWFFHCHNDFHAITGMAGALVVNAPNDPKWDEASVGQNVWDTCGFETQNGGNFTSWSRSCCSSSSSCTNSDMEKVQVAS